ncbi:peptide/nickel transport system substrate-binding protein [Nakamurella panacisegetis]|uniref:Peptide/nickel transport system substrate-binding protein n=1 Tax=Nakamurella panacisegetis TaxID=1090615 RepID=A0A1H0MWQ3_9ACTN|nr:ABC transporter substrate-binding protein [Nakamurella panacisegetis]SDO84550.1 peptide/nickel transport system substrate-binding protein [Nakamurella panacisegetis]
MRIRRWTAGAVAASLVVTVAACGSSSTATSTSAPTAAGSGGAGSSSSSAAGTVTSSGTLVVDTAFQLKTADPGRMFEPTGLLIDHAMYSTLLTFAGDNVKKPVPDLASSYTASKDGKVYTFKLRTDAVFSDGTPVTSADVVFSLNRVANLKGNPSFLMAGITVTAPDAHTVVLTSATPNPAIPFIVPNSALGILNSKAVKAAGGSDDASAATSDKAETALNTKSQGAGPYTLDSYSTTTQVVMEANPKYWGTKPKYEKIIVRNVQANVQKLNVLKGQSQIAVDLSPAQADGLGSSVQTINGASPNVFFLFTNNSPAVSKVTSNPDFQDAVRYGVDYDSLVSLAGTGAVQANGIIPTMFLGSLAAGTGVKRDLAKAKAALAKSGLTNPTVTLSYPSDIQVNGLNFGDLAARVQANLKDVGITVKLAPASVQTALDSYRGGKEEMGLWEWGPDYPDPSDYLNFLPGQVVGKRANWLAGQSPALEALGKQAASTIDDATRVKQYTQIQTMMNQSGPIMPLIQPAQILVAANSVKNVKANALWLVDLSELG